MLNRLKKSNNEGFTIIEVMIVLAIAGLILLIVFLAVPALQRSSRNTQRKNDASNVLSAVGTFVSNSNGALPATSADLTTVMSNVKLGYFTNSEIHLQAGGTIPAASTTNGDTSTSKVTTEDVWIITGATCTGNTPTTSGASARAYIVTYEVETGGAPVQQCVAS